MSQMPVQVRKRGEKGGEKEGERKGEEGEEDRKGCVLIRED